MSLVRTTPSLLVAAMACGLGACGGSPGAVSISVQPPSANVTTGGAVSFAATVAGTTRTGVTWSVLESEGGRVGADGSYTAPLVAGTYHVAATSVADASARALAAVVVTEVAPVVTLEINPYQASLTPGQSLQFSAAVSGSADTAVAWSIQEGAAGGMIGADGSYVAPQAEGTYHVVATSHGDPGESAAATVAVAVVPVVTVALSPRTAALITLGKMTFTATVTGTPDTAVAWTVQEGASGGAVGATGLYTAPSAAGTYHVVATSHADVTKKDTATVTVTTPPAVAVQVTPGSAPATFGQTVQFSATVTGSGDTAVSWTVQEGAGGGTMSATGLYTAPSAAGTYHVVATSHADGTKKGTATVTVGAALSIKAMPRITVAPDKAFGATGGFGTFARLVDDAYRRSTYGDPGAWTPASASWWAAVKIGAGPTQVLLSWADEDSGDGDFTGTYNPTLFSSYTIQTSADSTDGTDGTWTTVVTVTGNVYASRLHLVPFSGKSWLKMVNTAGTGTIGELELWDASSGNADTFFLHGDSIANSCSKRGDDNNPSLVPTWTFQDVAAQLTSGSPAWQPSTAYAVNAMVANVGRVYRCTTAGTSGGGGLYDGGAGPHGVGATTDGTARWSYVGDAVHWPQVIGAGDIGHSSGDAVGEIAA